MNEMPNRASEIPFSPDDHSDDSAVRYSSAFAKPSVVPPSFSARRSDSTPPGVTRRSEVEDIRPKDDSVGDSMLSRYFRDMATHQVMGPDEELQAAKEVEQAEVERTAAERDVQRYRRGFEGGAVAQVDLANAEDRLQNAEIALASAREDDNLQIQGAGLDTRNRRLLADRQRAVVDELRRQVDALTLRSPFDGQVGQVQVAQRSNVADNAPVLTVVDLSEFEVEIRVPESFARELGIGMPAQLTGGGNTYPAEVSAVSPEVVSGEVTARLRFSGDAPPGLRQNQRLGVRVLLDTREDVLMVERGPFLDQGGGRFAYVMDGSTAVRTPIEAGASSLSAVEIISGAKEGDRIVVSGSDRFGNAERVKIN